MNGYAYEKPQGYDFTEITESIFFCHPITYTELCKILATNEDIKISLSGFNCRENFEFEISDKKEYLKQFSKHNFLVVTHPDSSYAYVYILIKYENQTITYLGLKLNEYNQRKEKIFEMQNRLFSVCSAERKNISTEIIKRIKEL